MKSILFLVIGVLWSVHSLTAQGIDESCIQNGPSACIDWDRGVVIAEGIGVPAKNASNSALKNASAQRAARLDAARNILEMVKGINLSSSTTVRDAMVASDVIRTRIQGYLHGLRPVGPARYFSDGTIKIRMEARLHRTIPEELVFRQQSQPSISAPQEIHSPPSNTSGSSAPTSAIDVNQIYTGLILDAREMGLQPAMSPKVVDEDGKEVYGSAYVDREFAVKHGMAGYAKTPEKAKGNDRVKGTPLLVKALGSTGKNRTNLVISNKAAQALRQIAATQTFLREARVVILL